MPSTLPELIMEISLIADAVTVSATQGLGFAKSVLSMSNNIFLYDSSSEQPSSGGGLLICAAMSPLDALAPPTVRSNRVRSVPRTLVRKQRRTRRRSQTGGGGPEDGEYSGFFGDGGDGPFGGGSGGGGRGWNSDNFGWSNWDEPSSSSPADPAFDFVYEVISWIALSNCLQFAFKRVAGMIAVGVSDPARERVPVRFSPIC